MVGARDEITGQFLKKYKNSSSVKIGAGDWAINPAYNQWRAMCHRLIRFKGCVSMQPEWEDFDVYMQWAEQQVGFLNRNSKGRLWHLDKDFLSEDVKIYSETTCVFIPLELNAFLCGKTNRVNKDLPLGVQILSSGVYRARCTDANGVRRVVGCYSTAEQAKFEYDKAKTAAARGLALKYEGLVDDRVIEKLKTICFHKRG